MIIVAIKLSINLEETANKSSSPAHKNGLPLRV